jgi:hypothetical protein
MDFKLTYDEAVELLERAVKDRGKDYTYPAELLGTNCVYFKNGQPSCIVGYVLSYKGVREEDLDSYENGSSVDGLEITGDHRAAVLLEWVQAYQDQGISWGESVELAVIRANKEYELEENED